MAGISLIIKILTKYCMCICHKGMCPYVLKLSFLSQAMCPGVLVTDDDADNDDDDDDNDGHFAIV